MLKNSRKGRENFNSANKFILLAQSAGLIFILTRGSPNTQIMRGRWWHKQRDLWPRVKFLFLFGLLDTKAY